MGQLSLFSTKTGTIQKILHTRSGDINSVYINGGSIYYSGVDSRIGCIEKERDGEYLAQGSKT